MKKNIFCRSFYGKNAGRAQKAEKTQKTAGYRTFGP
jgi:hypothetical protein